MTSSGHSSGKNWPHSSGVRASTSAATNLTISPTRLHKHRANRIASQEQGGRARNREGWGQGTRHEGRTAKPANTDAQARVDTKGQLPTHPPPPADGRSSSTASPSSRKRTRPHENTAYALTAARLCGLR